MEVLRLTGHPFQGEAQLGGGRASGFTAPPLLSSPLDEQVSVSHNQISSLTSFSRDALVKRIAVRD